MSALTEKGQAELRRFGWTLGPEFEQRYHSDAWVFNLVNAVERVAEQRDAALDALQERDEEIARLRADLETLVRYAIREIPAVAKFARAFLASTEGADHTRYVCGNCGQDTGGGACPNCGSTDQPQPSTEGAS